MAKKDFFSKLNMKNYNNEVELILEKKEFLSATKNLILNMFYKIEVSYQDYVMVKPYTVTKSEFIEYLMRVLEKECKEVQVINPVEILEKDIAPYIYSENNSKLIAYPNINSFLYSFISIDKKSFYIPNSYSLVKEAFKNFLNIAYGIDNIEVVRDFDGWSWNTNLKGEKYIAYNLVYQNLQILVGSKLFRDWKNDFDVIVDYIYKMIVEIEEQYNEQEAKDIYILICKVILSIYIDSEDKMENMKKELLNSKNKIELMEHKATFLQTVSNQKKEYVKQIKAIDTTINTPNLIEREFVIRNRKLDNEHKLFSINSLIEILNEERRDIIEKIQECNESIDPRIYARNIERLNGDIAIAENIETVIKEDILIELQKKFLAIFKIKVEKIQLKKDICELMVILRYYTNLKITENSRTKDILEKEIFEVQNILFKKACETKIIEIINKDIRFNSEILSNIMDTKIVDLTEIEIKLLRTIENELEIEVYEGEILESKKSIKIPENKMEFNVKMNKKFKLYN